MVLRRQLRAHPQAAGGGFSLAADLDRVLDDLAGVGDLQAQVELAAGDAGEVEQVVDQPRLELDVAPDHVQRPAQRGGDALIPGEPGGEEQHGGQRRAQLVAEGGEEVILRLVGGLGLGARLALAIEQPGALLLGLVAVGDVEHGPQHPHGSP